MFRILLAVTGLLIYGSLYPWHFHHARAACGPVHALLYSWQLSWNRFLLRDIVLNIAIYIPFGAAAYLWLSSRRILLRLAVPLCLAAILSVSIELIQFYDALRITSLVDVATNILGSAFGILLALPVAQHAKQASKIRSQQPGALLLLGCFAMAMLFPLLPDLSHTHLNGKLITFFNSPFSLPAMLALFVGWLLAARMLVAAFGESSPVMFPLLGLFLPARFLVAGVTADWQYWASFLASWLVWIAIFSGHRRDRFLAVLALAAVLLTGLAPFRFSAHASYFEWVPFRALFRTEWETGFALFLRKAFQYGCAVWLLRESGVKLRNAALLVAGILAALEAIQIYLPNHAAESTDPLLALVMAWLLHRLARAVANSTQDNDARQQKRTFSRAGTSKAPLVSNNIGRRS